VPHPLRTLQRVRVLTFLFTSNRRPSLGCGACLGDFSPQELRHKEVAGTTRLELATSAVTGQRSNQLNYVPTRQIHDFP